MRPLYIKIGLQVTKLLKRSSLQFSQLISDTCTVMKHNSNQKPYNQKTSHNKLVSYEIQPTLIFRFRHH